MKWHSRKARFSAAIVLVASLVYLHNASWLAPVPQGKPTVISHRGVYQTYDRTDLGRDDCTATRIFEPEHGYLENTIASWPTEARDP
jgi:glycerophosphoryl diester phosphodiesterase